MGPPEFHYINPCFTDHLNTHVDQSEVRVFYWLTGSASKTLQLGAIAKLIGILDPLPILIMVPKTLTTQWQDELCSPDCSIRRWEGGGWITERDEFHPALRTKPLLSTKVGIVPTSVITSAPLSDRNGSARESDACPGSHA